VMTSILMDDEEEDRILTVIRANDGRTTNKVVIEQRERERERERERDDDDDNLNSGHDDDVNGIKKDGDYDDDSGYNNTNGDCHNHMSCGW